MSCLVISKNYAVKTPQIYHIVPENCQNSSPRGGRQSTHRVGSLRAGTRTPPGLRSLDQLPAPTSSAKIPAGPPQHSLK